MKKLSVGIIGGMGDSRFLAKLEPLIVSNYVSKVYLFRYKGNVLTSNSKVITLPLSSKGSRPLGILPRAFFDIYNFIGFFILGLFGKIDLLVGLYLYPHGLYASILGYLLNIPYVLILPGTDLKKLRETHKAEYLFKNANFLAMRGNNSIDKLAKIGFSPNKMFILHNVFNIDDYEFPNNTSKKFDVVFTGFLRPLKRLDILLEAIKIVKLSGHPNIQVQIVGDGAMKSSLASLAEKLGLQQNIVFKAYVKPISSVLYESRVFIMTSESEGLPMSMIEAMACGLPVIVPNINDIPDIVENNINGFLVDVLDVNMFALRIKQLLDNHDLASQMGREARKKIERLFQTEFSFSAITNRWESVLKSIF